MSLMLSCLPDAFAAPVSAADNHTGPPARVRMTQPAPTQPPDERQRTDASAQPSVAPDNDKIIRPSSFVLRHFIPWLAAACFAVTTAWFGRLYLTGHSEAALLHEQQTLADLALKSARTQLETERFLTGQQRANLDRQLADTTRLLTATTARLTSTDRLLAAARNQLADERAATSQRLAALDQQLAALQSKSGDAARQLDAARKLLAAHDAELDEQAKRIAAIAAQAPRESDLAQFKITTLASMLKNSPQALAVAVWNPATQQGVLQVDKLPALAADKDYQLWVVDPQYPAPVDGGVFTVNAQTGAAHVQFKAKQPVNAINAFSVTLERKGGAPRAEGPFVLLGK